MVVNEENARRLLGNDRIILGFWTMFIFGFFSLGFLFSYRREFSIEIWPWWNWYGWWNFAAMCAEADRSKSNRVVLHDLIARRSSSQMWFYSLIEFLAIFSISFFVLLLNELFKNCTPISSFSQYFSSSCFSSLSLHFSLLFSLTITPTFIMIQSSPFHYCPLSPLHFFQVLPHKSSEYHFIH